MRAYFIVWQELWQEFGQELGKQEFFCRIWILGGARELEVCKKERKGTIMPFRQYSAYVLAKQIS
jgi:hypothetical protein